MFGESGESGFFTRRDLARDATEMFLCGLEGEERGRQDEVVLVGERMWDLLARGTAVFEGNG